MDSFRKRTSWVLRFIFGSSLISGRLCACATSTGISLSCVSCLCPRGRCPSWENFSEFNAIFSFLVLSSILCNLCCTWAFIRSGSSDYQNARVFFSEETVGTRKRRNKYELAPGLLSVPHADVRTCSVSYPRPLRVQW